VRSLIEALGTDAVRRVKVGIGRPEPPAGSGRRREEVVDHVLSPFYPEEHEIVEAACQEAARQVIKLLDRREGA
jgi:peptidyl-tRNA hydrolase